MNSLRAELLVCAMAWLFLCSTGARAAELDSGLLQMAARSGPVDVLLVFPSQRTPLLSPLGPQVGYLEHRRALVAALRARADAEQAPIRAWLDNRGIRHREYWIANVIATTLDTNQLHDLANRHDITRIAANPQLAVQLPSASQRPQQRGGGLPWGLVKINVADAWAAGVTGEGVVVAGEDTGYQWDHPALKVQYRGWNGSGVDHDYNWHDAIHVGGSSCGAESPEPCDDYGHGTHTMGTMIGDDGGPNQIGVAPDAEWIGCRNMNSGFGTPARYIECMQWMLAPTDLAGQNPDPAKAPDVINNSWACVFDEGCTVGNELDAAVHNLVAGGIVFVASAGNSGPGCATIGDPPAIHDGSFVVGASDSADAVAGFSSRGPVVGSLMTRPDIVAPGVDVRSSIPGGGYANYNGTSMAGPHVAGVAALMMSVNPELRGEPILIAQMLRASAATSGLTDPFNTSCGGLTMADWPNHQAGYGRLDAWAAVQLADTIFADGFHD